MKQELFERYTAELYFVKNGFDQFFDQMPNSIVVNYEPIYKSKKEYEKVGRKYNTINYVDWITSKIEKIEKGIIHNKNISDLEVIITNELFNATLSLNLPIFNPVSGFFTNKNNQWNVVRGYIFKNDTYVRPHLRRTKIVESTQDLNNKFL